MVRNEKMGVRVVERQRYMYGGRTTQELLRKCALYADSQTAKASPLDFPGSPVMGVELQGPLGDTNSRNEKIKGSIATYSVHKGSPRHSVQTRAPWLPATNYSALETTTMNLLHGKKRLSSRVRLCSDRPEVRPTWHLYPPRQLNLVKRSQQTRETNSSCH